METAKQASKYLSSKSNTVKLASTSPRKTLEVYANSLWIQVEINAESDRKPIQTQISD